MDYYELLGVTPGATSDEIRAAYRKLARRYHPDLNPGDAESEKKFKEIAEAYSVLSDADLRRKYDESSDRRKRGGKSDLDDLFDMIGSVFGSASFKGERGSRKGSTRNHRTTKNCARCNGAGMIGGDFGFFVFKIVCPRCLGTGKKIV
jgi:molecular chaperone DnaJ